MIVLTMLVTALLHAATTSKRDWIALRCPASKVHVRIFDENGALLVDFERVLNWGNEPLEWRETQSTDASKRYVTTSASRGCIQGASDRDLRTGAPLNAFDMPCRGESPIDLRITSEPPATFIVRRDIQSASGATCHWQMSLNRSSTIDHYTSDEKLIIDGTAIADSHMTGHLEIDADHVPRTKTIIPNPSRAGHGGSTVKELKSFTIEPLPQ